MCTIIRLMIVCYELILCKIPVTDHQYLPPTTCTSTIYLLLTITIVWMHMITLPPSIVYHLASLVLNNLHVKIQ